MITLPPLPFAKNALEPHMSADTLATHHGKHHKAYVDKTNALIAGTPHEQASLEDIVMAASRDGNTKLFDQAAQAWNHDFLWKSFSPQGGGQPGAALGDALSRSFGGFDGFRKKWTDEATGHFGSGWCWLVEDGGKLAIISTHDADTPLAHGKTPLLTLDLWEHAYYLDWKNERPKYVAAFLDHLANWDFADANLRASGMQAAA